MVLSHFMASTLILLLLVSLPASSTVNSNSGDTVYLNGTIITMNDAAPQAQAIAVRDGKILAVGSRNAVLAKTDDARLIDLEGKTLLPGFIDAHGHVSMTVPYMALANVASPPVGPVTDIPSLQAVLAKRAAKTPKGQAVIGRSYDDSLLAEKRHPDRRDLDAVSTEHPVFIVHVSGHLASCNTKCLQMLGYDANTKDPAGGVIQRLPGSREPNGVLEETAAFALYPHVFIRDEERVLTLIKKASDYYASFGVTSLEDGAAGLEQVRMLQMAADRGALDLDVVAYIRATELDKIKGEFLPDKHYRNHYRVGGIKLLFDGSPQGKTAHLSEPYHIPPPGQDKHYRGYGVVSDKDAQRAIDTAYKNNWQIYAHANGDAAAERFINTIERAEKKQGKGDRRPTLIHAQILREDQLDRMSELAIIPSFFVSHTFFWGDWHRESVLGKRRASRISPVKSAIDRGMPYTLHNDAEVTPPDMMRLVWSAVNRQTRSGKVLGADQRISVMEALKGITLYAAYQHFEDDIKGSLEPGKLADFVILEDNPLTVAPAAIKDIRVLETIKEGNTLFVRD